MTEPIEVRIEAIAKRRTATLARAVINFVTVEEAVTAAYILGLRDAAIAEKP